MLQWVVANERLRSRACGLEESLLDMGDENVVSCDRLMKKSYVDCLLTTIHVHPSTFYSLGITFSMQILPYRAEFEHELWLLFFNTIRTVNARDYSPEQLEVWAPETKDEDRWIERMEGIQPFVCVVDGQIVGYAGIVDDGYVDHFYVHHQWQRKGAGSALMAQLEQVAIEKSYPQMTSDVSLTARPFFESKGFQVVTPQEVVRDSVVLQNFKMRKSLA